VSAPDYFTVEWSPTRGLAIVRSTCDEIPWAECDEAAHQLLAAGNMARRINGPIARGDFAGDQICVACKHVKAAHLPQDGACVRTTGDDFGDCPCLGFVDPTGPDIG